MSVLDAISNALFGEDIPAIEKRVSDMDPWKAETPGAVWVAADLRYTPQTGQRMMDAVIANLERMGYTVFSIRAGEYHVVVKIGRPGQSVNPAVAREDLKRATGAFTIATAVSTSAEEVGSQIVAKSVRDLGKLAEDVADKLPTGPTLGIGIGAVLAIAALIYLRSWTWGRA